MSFLALLDGQPVGGGKDGKANRSGKINALCPICKVRAAALRRRPSVTWPPPACTC